MNLLSRSHLLALALLPLAASAAWAESAPIITDRAPTVVSVVQPVRTRSMLNFGVTGTVEVTFTITAEGRVEQPVIHRSNDPLLEAPVLAAIRQWKFKPAVKGGQAVAVRARQAFTFEDPNLTAPASRDLPAVKPAPPTMIATSK